MLPAQGSCRQISFLREFAEAPSEKKCKSLLFAAKSGGDAHGNGLQQTCQAAGRNAAALRSRVGWPNGLNRELVADL